MEPDAEPLYTSENSTILDIDHDRLKQKLAITGHILKQWQVRMEKKEKEVRRLLTIKGDHVNCNSIFDRIGLDPKIDLDEVLEDEGEGNH